MFSVCVGLVLGSECTISNHLRLTLVHHSRLPPLNSIEKMINETQYQYYMYNNTLCILY
jgi:hypothetical protein